MTDLTCPHCKRSFEKRTQHLQHVADRLKTGTCRKTIEAAKGMRIENMIEASRNRPPKEKPDDTPITDSDCEEWT